MSGSEFDGGTRRRDRGEDRGIEGEKEKERGATKVAVTPCKASKPSGQPWRKKTKKAVLRGNAEGREGRGGRRRRDRPNEEGTSGM